VLVDMEGIQTGTAVCLCLSGVFVHILRVRGARAGCRTGCDCVHVFCLRRTVRVCIQLRM